MEKTVPSPYSNKTYIGYVLNTEFTSEAQQFLNNLARNFSNRFGEVIQIPEPQGLHITLMDWLAPLVDYDRDKDEIFPELFPTYDQALEETVHNIGPITVNFNQLAASPEAIFIRGSDDGQYQKIRDSFVGKIALLPNTKRPPKIIHSTIARFNVATDLSPIQDFAAQQQLSLNVTVNNFRLLRSTDTKMQDLKVIKRYHLR